MCCFKRSKGGNSHLRKRVEDDKIVERLVNEFDTKIPKLEFSPVKILLFLLEYRQSLKDVISNVEAWMTRIRKKGRERGE